MTIENKIDVIVKWLKDYKEQSGVAGYIVGISGGIDSAVVAHLIKKACPDNSMGVIMPCYSNDADKNDALKVIESSKIEYTEVDLSLTFDNLTNALGENMGADPLIKGNAKARLRMTTLYAIAQSKGYLVAGTDNAAEWHTGYFTKYGDGGVDIVPIVHLTKGEVYEMAQILGVHQDILERKPTAGLWEGQTDEDEMGVTYNTIDAYLSGEEINIKDKEIIDGMHKRSMHKRSLAAAPDIDLFK